ncbi:MAG TPA: alpha/beta hydrolase [Xanthobacteraceae bacterium]|nr:alpha/beta hydrolase [Xanthobacteraceae bacterium]
MNDARAAAEAAAEPDVRRWTEQRWLVDNVIRANGIDWDQPRSVYMNAACGFEASADFAAIRERVRKYADITPAFVATARRREARARAAEADGLAVTARDNYFMAAVHWGAAQWTLHDDGPDNLACNASKRSCYDSYARLADHRIERVDLPFRGKTIPAWFHLPPGYQGGKIPAVISFPGMDTFKELFVALNGDRWLSRGIAVLALDGPGQAECRLNGLTVSMENWTSVGKPVFDWLSSRPEIDPARIGIFGNSFGSFFATLVTASEPRIMACIANATCLEPGFHTIFQEASPTYKKRFMYMAGFSDEAGFDRFRRTLTWEGHAERIRVPYLCVAGEAEELSPLVYAERMLARMQTPRRFVVYQDARHAISAAPSVSLGPYPPTMVADWMIERFAGKPLASERWYVEANGNVAKTPLA